MKAAVLGENGVEIRDVPKPVPKPHEVLVRVHAAALNRADVLIASGQAHGFIAAPGTVLGGECAGEIVAVGSDVASFKPGERLAGSAPGSFAEYAAVDAGRAYRMPATGMAYDRATCLPWALQTMHNAVVTAGRLETAESVLIQGASSGVGLLGLQIARLKGATVVLGTSTDESRRARLKEFGCDVALDSRDPDPSRSSSCAFCSARPRQASFPADPLSHLLVPCGVSRQDRRHLHGRHPGSGPDRLADLGRNFRHGRHPGLGRLAVDLHPRSPAHPGAGCSGCRGPTAGEPSGPWRSS